MVRIICEGKSDKFFLELFLKHLNIKFKDDDFSLMSGKNFLLDGKHDKYIMLKKQIAVGKISKLLFILDADSIGNDAKCGGYDNTTRCIENLIKKLKIKGISDYVILCEPNTKIGYLESLILSTLNTEQKKCIETFLKCSEMEDKDNHKKIVNSIYKLHYPKSGYDFKHSNFKELRDNLCSLFDKR